MYLQYNKSGTTGDLAGPSKLVKISRRAPKQYLTESSKKTKVSPAYIIHNRHFRKAFHTLQWASILQQGQQHVKLFALAPGGLLCSAGCPTPTDSLRLPSDPICHSDASPAQGHGSKRWCSLLALQGPLDLPLKVKSWKLKVLTCAGPWVCIRKHLLPAVCNPVTGPLGDILGRRP